MLIPTGTNTYRARVTGIITTIQAKDVDDALRIFAYFGDAPEEIMRYDHDALAWEVAYTKHSPTVVSCEYRGYNDSLTKAITVTARDLDEAMRQFAAKGFDVAHVEARSSTQNLWVTRWAKIDNQRKEPRI